VLYSLSVYKGGKFLSRKEEGVHTNFPLTSHGLYALEVSNAGAAMIGVRLFGKPTEPKGARIDGNN
jgi:hypothetical protein